MDYSLKQDIGLWRLKLTKKRRNVVIYVAEKIEYCPDFFGCNLMYDGPRPR